jgi:hypothetical protein
MATPAARRLLRAPGRLVAGPSSLSGSFPYGGTALGASRAVILKSYGAYYPVTAAELGGEPVEYLERGEIWGCQAFMRGADDDALAALFPNTAAGATTQHKVVSGPGTNKAGFRVSARSVVLLFVPDDITRAPAWILYRACPMPAEPTDIQQSAKEEYGFDARFMGIRDTSSRVIAIGRLEDLSL